MRHHTPRRRDPRLCGCQPRRFRIGASSIESHDVAPQCAVQAPCVVGREARLNLHVAVDALGVKSRGGAATLLAFLDAAIRDDRISRITVFCSPRLRRDFALPASWKVTQVEQARAERSYLYRSLWFEHLLGEECRRIGADVLMCMVGAGRSSGDVPSVTFIQQPLPFSAEGLRLLPLKDQLRMRVIKALMRRSCRHACAVIVQTQTMKSWVSCQLSVSGDRIHVAVPCVPLPWYNDVSPQMADRRLLQDAPVLLYVGSAAPYKNVETIISGMPFLRQTFPDARLHLTWPKEQHVETGNGVAYLGYVEHDRLPAILIVSPTYSLCRHWWRPWAYH